MRLCHCLLLIHCASIDTFLQHKAPFSPQEVFTYANGNLLLLVENPSTSPVGPQDPSLSLSEGSFSLINDHFFLKMMYVEIAHKTISSLHKINMSSKLNRKKNRKKILTKIVNKRYFPFFLLFQTLECQRY